MRKLIPLVVLAVSLAVLAGGGGFAEASSLPSASAPNAPGSVRVPTAFSIPPRVPERRSYPQLLELWQRAGAAYGVPWQVLGAINKIESNFGRNMGPSSAGALGWMQFMPSTWMRWGMDANGDGVASPWNPEDGVYSAARYLAAAGGRRDISRAIFAYNHAQWYVNDVLELARLFGADGSSLATDLGGGLFAPSVLPLEQSGPKLVFRIDDIEQRLAKAQRRVTRARQAVVEAEGLAESVDWKILAAQRKAGNASLTGAQFRKLERKVTRLTMARDRSAETIENLRERLAYEVTRLDELRKEAAVQESAVTFTRSATGVLGGAVASGDYVFPVGGGPSVVSVAHVHHDYPAADIAAPEGSPLYALADSVVVASWPSPTGRCGIGLQLRTGDGQVYVYCHLAYLEPDVRPGAALAAGAPVGLVGTTGHSTGPHLHLQFSPATHYPQEEAWFRSFAGRAFSWQDAPTPVSTSSSSSAPTGGGPVFDVVDSGVITFTR